MQIWKRVILFFVAMLCGVGLLAFVQNRGWVGAGAVEHVHDRGESVMVEEKVLYNCPMHPEVIRDHPGTCPLCGMDLVPMKATSGADKMPAGAVRVDPAVVQSIGVRVVLVEERELARTQLLPGEIAMDPQRVAIVNSRVMGWVERVAVANVGVYVKAGQLLATLYSPDLVAAQEDYLLALRGRDDALRESARKRLQVLGVAEVLIDSITMLGHALRDFPVLAPIGGVVLTSNVVTGQNVMAGTDLYKIVDLSKVWAIGRAYAEETALLRVGMAAEVRGGASAPARSGSVALVAPVVETASKTVEVRVAVRNTEAPLFRPGQVVDVRIVVPLGHGIAIPMQAVIRTGTRNVGIVSLGGGYFAPRELLLGASLGDSVQVLEGLAAGDSLVTSAQFLIDSESHLQKAVEKMKM